MIITIKERIFTQVFFYTISGSLTNCLLFSANTPAGQAIPQPLEDPASMNKRRKSAGLEPLELSEPHE
jgi:hypothetical protein